MGWLRQSLESILDDNEDMALMFLGRRERARAAAEAEQARADSGAGGARNAAAADDEELVSRAQEQARRAAAATRCSYPVQALMDEVKVTRPRGR